MGILAPALALVVLDVFLPLPLVVGWFVPHVSHTMQARAYAAYARGSRYQLVRCLQLMNKIRVYRSNCSFEYYTNLVDALRNLLPLVDVHGRPHHRDRTSREKHRRTKALDPLVAIPDC